MGIFGRVTAKTDTPTGLIFRADFDVSVARDRLEELLVGV